MDSGRKSNRKYTALDFYRKTILSHHLLCRNQGEIHMDPVKIFIIGTGHHDLAFAREIMEQLNNEAHTPILGIMPSGYFNSLQDDAAFVHGITECFGTEKDMPVFVFHNQEERITEMRKSLLALAVGHALALAIRPFGESLYASIILSTVRQRTGFGMRVSQHRKYPRVSARTGHILPLKLKVPRGIHRDNHGRPRPQKLTPARLKGRNGSRK